MARRCPIGAEPVEDGGVHFRVWAPKSRRVRVEFGQGDLRESFQEAELASEPNSYYSSVVKSARAGMKYRFKLDRGSFPDPASRFQPEGPHGPSEIVDPTTFQWQDASWQGLPLVRQAIYELHLGTFTQEGTWSAALEHLEELASLGITTIELMPIAEFPGRFGWGYDGVDLFAPTRLYGRPDEFRQFVNRAHGLGLGVILDVVYNHFGPDGNYLKNFADAYFTDRYANEWGEAINFDGENSGPVREFFCANAGYWIEEFHLDGLRLDATQQIFDSSPENIHVALMRAVRQAAKGRSTFVVAENETQNAQLARSIDRGGYGLDALWNDDWHHAAMVALTGHSEAYYSDFKGGPQEFVSAAKHGFIFQGQWSGWQKKARGSPSLDIAPERFVIYLQNHDQVANSLSGRRVHQLASAGRLRALTALLLLSPATPMLFQGQEFGASAPFLYFADHKPELARLVAEGRKSFLSQFETINNEHSRVRLAKPDDFETFARCKLNRSERSRNQELYQMHRDLLRLRREDPVFSNPRLGGVDGAVLGTDCFVLRFFAEKGSDRLMLINLGADLLLTQLCEPLLASPDREPWFLLWSSEDPAYGGNGVSKVQSETGWMVPGHTSIVLAASAPSPAASTRTTG
jgi:maltooligosyltrehalose trehalohydrolase